MDTDSFISSGILEVYVLGIASYSEKEEVEEMLQKHPEIVSEMNAINAALESYALSNGIVPAASVKANVLNRSKNPQNLLTKEKSAEVISMKPWLRWVAVASVVLLTGSVLFNVIFFEKYSKTQTALIETRQKLQTQSLATAELQKGMSIVQNKYSIPVALQGLPPAPDAAAKIFWIRNTGEVYVDPSNLPSPPAGKQYQLWGIVDGKPVDGGMINIAPTTGFKIQKMRSFGKAEAFAITLEVTGGNPTPKGEMYVLGKI